MAPDPRRPRRISQGSQASEALAPTPLPHGTPGSEAEAGHASQWTPDPARSDPIAFEDIEGAFAHAVYRAARTRQRQLRGLERPPEPDRQARILLRRLQLKLGVPA